MKHLLTDIHFIPHALSQKILQAAAIMLYTQVRLWEWGEVGAYFICLVLAVVYHCYRTAQSQETCLYARLNAALRKHDSLSLEPFLPYMKLLLSGLYHLPITQVRTYRGVKLEMFKVSGNG